VSTPFLPVRSTTPPSFYDFSRQSLAGHLAELGLPGYRASQLFGWVYRKHVLAPDRMRNLPREFRDRLGSLLDLELPPVVTALGTPDGHTHKFVLRLGDGAQVECVSMRTERRLTLCVSSQVGCALRCSFCATGLMGLERNLRAGEI